MAHPEAAPGAAGFAVPHIPALDPERIAQAQHALDNKTKPLGSLGRLEDCARRLAAIQETLTPTVDPARVYTVAGDHGVVLAGVSPFPQAVTRQMVHNFLAGGAAINVLCQTSDIQLRVVDAGVAGDPFPEHPALIQHKIALGTANLAAGPAMTPDQCAAALNLGMDLAARAQAEGIRCIGTGEMGIGNTTPSTALYCAFLKLDPAQCTGPGAGLDSPGVSRKTATIRDALALHAETIRSQDPIAILAALGGLEIATLAGLVLGCASRRIPIVIDGFISGAAFITAQAINPACADYAFHSHASAEPGHQVALARIDAQPLLNLGLRLGEGTGAALAIPILRAGCNILRDMASFEDAGVSRG